MHAGGRLPLGALRSFPRLLSMVDAATQVVAFRLGGPGNNGASGDAGGKTCRHSAGDVCARVPTPPTPKLHVVGHRGICVAAARLAATHARVDGGLAAAFGSEPSDVAEP